MAVKINDDGYEDIDEFWDARMSSRDTSTMSSKCFFLRSFCNIFVQEYRENMSSKCFFPSFFL